MLFCLLESSSRLECCEAVVMGIQHRGEPALTPPLWSRSRQLQLLHWSGVPLHPVPFPRNERSTWVYLTWDHALLSSGRAVASSICPWLAAAPTFYMAAFMWLLEKQKLFWSAPFPSSSPPVAVPLGNIPLTTLPRQGLLVQRDAFPCLPQAFLSSERHMVNSSLYCILLLFISFQK